MNLSEERKREPEERLTEKERDDLRSTVGGLMWVARMTRPDVLAEAARLSGLTEPTIRHGQRANKMVRKLKKDSTEIWYEGLAADTCIFAHGDAAKDNLPNGGSQGDPSSASLQHHNKVKRI